MPPRRRAASNDKLAEDLAAAFADTEIKVSADETLPFDLSDDDPTADREIPPLPPGPKKRAGSLQKQLEGMYASIGSMTYMFNPVIGATIVQNASQCAESMDELARTNPKVRKALTNMLATGAWSGVVVAHMPILMAVAHEFIPQFKQMTEPEPVPFQ